MNKELHKQQDIVEPDNSSLTRPKLDQDVLGPSPSDVGTVYYSESARRPDGENDVKSSLSMRSMNTTTQDEYRRQEAGRLYNVLNEAYFLPTDDDEFTRLNKQHLAVVIALSSLYTAPQVVETILAKREGEQQKILDVGCGTGVWTVAMAKAFPHCEVVGIDLAPVPLESEAIPPNCRFELDDVNNSLTHYHDLFSVVHARFIGAGLRDHKKCKEEIERCLKPGGIVLWMDGDYDMCTKERDVYSVPASDAHPDGSWFTRILFETSRATLQMGVSDLFAMSSMLSLGLWDDPLLDPETCGAGDLFMPIGPWATDPNPLQNQRLSHVGTLIRQDLSNGHRALHAPLRKVGISAETCNEWSELADKGIALNSPSAILHLNVHEEMNEMKKPLFLRFACAWGRRRAAPGKPAPPLPPVSPSTEREDDLPSSLPPYPFFDLFESKEQAKESYERRNKSKTYTPPPNPPGLQA
ncbi:hypothetical protein PIIN_05845 [Serendipita indica DSM 11827]|uniref:Methyltransferase domain-containing protein n=1 Tax=Serendipita indica (strain DSM 11827) TaxID=1109443 RepID=G4TKR7_SERID|nr:hypothetical protein PIIN_05845 [Serendipita indica DSM 11827]